APAGLRLSFVEQHEQLGTGDAAAVGLTGFEGDADLEGGDLLILPGDAPLVRARSLGRLLAAEHREHQRAATLLSTVMEDPTGYGRVLHARGGQVAGIVEQTDATEDEL